MSDIQDFAGDVLDEFSGSVTDSVFCFIQADAELMHRYLCLVSDHSVDTVNRQLGKAIKARFGLNDAPTRAANPRSVLIKSHQEFLP